MDKKNWIRVYSLGLGLGLQFGKNGQGMWFINWFLIFFILKNAKPTEKLEDQYNEHSYAFHLELIN